MCSYTLDTFSHVLYYVAFFNLQIFQKTCTYRRIFWYPELGNVSERQTLPTFTIPVTRYLLSM